MQGPKQKLLQKITGTHQYSKGVRRGSKTPLGGEGQSYFFNVRASSWKTPSKTPTTTTRASSGNRRRMTKNSKGPRKTSRPSKAFIQAETAQAEECRFGSQ